MLAINLHPCQEPLIELIKDQRFTCIWKYYYGFNKFKAVLSYGFYWFHKGFLWLIGGILALIISSPILAIALGLAVIAAPIWLAMLASYLRKIYQARLEENCYLVIDCAPEEHIAVLTSIRDIFNGKKLILKTRDHASSIPFWASFKTTTDVDLDMENLEMMVPKLPGVVFHGTKNTIKWLVKRLVEQNIPCYAQHNPPFRFDKKVIYNIKLEHFGTELHDGIIIEESEYLLEKIHEGNPLLLSNLLSFIKKKEKLPDANIMNYDTDLGGH
jgi:hypothetical protein